MSKQSDKALEMVREVLAREVEDPTRGDYRDVLKRLEDEFSSMLKDDPVASPARPGAENTENT